MKSYEEILIITGGLGHIGSSLFSSLQNNNRLIIVNDNLSSERFCSTFDYHLKHNIKFIFGDIREKQFEKSVIDLCKNIDYKKITIIHLAAITDAASSFDKADNVKENNLNGTRVVIELANTLDANLIFPSSTSVYGDNSELVTEASKLFPQSPYAETKISEEEIIQKYEKSIILRLGTIVGPSQGMRFHTAVNSFIWKALINQPIQIWKTAYNQKRPYLCLKDFVNLIQFILNKDLYNQSIFNILNENSTPKIITDEIRTHIPNLEIEFVDSKIMNQLTYEVSKELIENEGFKFELTIKEAILDTIEFLKSDE
jgi:UDP-glucose 4-epimerase